MYMQGALIEFSRLLKKRKKKRKRAWRWEGDMLGRTWGSEGWVWVCSRCILYVYEMGKGYFFLYS